MVQGKTSRKKIWIGIMICLMFVMLSMDWGAEMVYADVTQDGLWEYSDSYGEEGATIQIDSYLGEDDGNDVIIPSEIEGMPVTSIGEGAFSYCSNLSSIEIPDSVTNIGEYAFSDCSSLSSIEIPDGVTSIGEGAFTYCSSLSSIEIPDSVTNIGESTFANCSSLSSIEIPDSVMNIGENAFTECTSLRVVDIPSNVTSIGRYAFFSCTGLISMVIPGSVTELGEGAFRDCTSLSSVELENGLASIDAYTFMNCTNLSSIKIPDTVTNIGDSAFRECTGLSNIELSDKLITIGMGAFVRCTSLKNVQIPSGVTRIENQAFLGCSSLIDIKISNDINYIGELAFYECDSLERVELSDSVKYIGKNAFGYCLGLKSVALSDSITYIGENAFEECSGLERMELPDSVTYIGESAFRGCSGLKYINIPKGVTQLEDRVFAMCSGLNSIDIPENVTKIGRMAFWDSGLTYISIPDSVIEMGDSVFLDCTRLESVKLSNGLSQIVESTFSKCVSLSHIEIPTSVKYVASYAFRGCSSLKNVVIPDSVTTIWGSSFEGCSNLECIEIPKSVVEMEEDIFTGCDKLTIVTPKDSVAYQYAEANNISWKKLGAPEEPDTPQNPDTPQAPDTEYEPDNMWEYTTVTNPQGEKTVVITKYLGTKKELAIPPTINGMKVTHIEKNTFANSDLEVVTLHAGIIDIGENAFAGCNRLTIIAPYGSMGYIYATQNHIPWRGLNGESNADTSAEDQYWKYSVQNDGSVMIEAYLGTKQEVRIPDTIAGKKVASIALGAFRKRADIISIKMPNTITYIGVSAFEECTQLESIELSNSLSVLQEATFFMCSNLKIIKIPDGVVGIGKSAFYGCVALNTIEIPESVKTIENFAFEGCNNLTIYSTINAHAYNYAMEHGIKWMQLVLYTTTESNNVGPDDIMFKIYGRTAYAKGQWFNFDEKEAHSRITNAQFVKGTTTQTIADYKVTLPYGNGISGIYGTFKKADYQDYVIPNEVVWRWDAAQKKSFNIYMDDDRKDGKPYISAIFARSIDSPTYVDARAEELKFKAGEKIFVYITACGADANTTYYLTQDENHKISSPTGYFKNEILYDKFQADKPIYAYIKTGNGTISEMIEVKLSKMELDQSAMDVLNATSFSAFGPNGWSLTIPESVALIGGSKIELDAPKIPVGYSITGDKVRISVGWNIWGKDDDAETAEWKWKSLKEQCDSMDKYIENTDKKVETFNKLLESVKNIANNGLPEDKKPVWGDSEKENSFGVNLLGYMELQMVGGKLRVIEVSGTLSASFKYRYVQQLVIAGIPAYFYIEAGGEAGVTLNTVNLTGDPDMPYNFGAVINIEPALTIGGGAGASGVASIGLYGKASLPIMVDLTSKYYDISLTGEFGAEGEFFALSHRVKIVSGTLHVVSGYYGKTKAATKFTNELYSPTVAMDVMVCENITTTSRAYADTTTDWSAVPLDVEQVSKFAVSDLQKSVYGNGQCQIISFGEKMMMAWIEDCSERDEYNRLRLMYAVYDETTGTWSEAKAVHDDGTSDAAPRLATDGEQLYIVWQNINQVIASSDENAINQLMESAEIMLAKYNVETGEFEEPTRVTENATYDYSPAVSVEDGNAVVYWVNSQATDLEAGTLSIWKQKAGEEASALYQGLNYISSLVCDGDSVSYNMDTDGRLATVEDVYLYTNGEKVPSVESTILRFAYGKLNDKNTLFYADDSNLYYVENGESKPIFNEARRINDNLKVVNHGTKTSVVWSELAEEGSALYICEYVDGVWGQPVLLGNMKEDITNMDISYCGDLLYGIFNRTERIQKTNEDGTVQYEKGLTDFCQFTSSDFSDLEVDIPFVDESAFIKGKNTPVAIYVKNKGRKQIQNVVFNIADTLGTSATVSKEINLLPGEQAMVNVDYLIAENFDKTTLTVGATLENETDMNLEDNTVTKPLGYCDLQMGTLQLEKLGKTYVVSGEVINESFFDAHEVSVDIMFGTKENTPISTIQLGDIAAGERRYVEFTLEESNVHVNCDEQDLCFVYFSSKSQETEALTGNNTSAITIEKQETQLLKDAKITLNNNTYVYDGTAKEPEVTVIIGSATLEEGTDYIVTYNNNVAAGTASVTVRGVGLYVGTEEQTFVIKPKSDFSVKLETTSYTYNGKERKPAVVVKDGARTMKKGTDYTVTYKNNKEVGKATVTVKGVNNYTGTKTLAFQIKPSKVTSFKQNTSSYSTSKIKMTWKKVSGANGYTVYRSTSKNGTYKSLKTVTTNSCENAGLKAGSKYYYKVRAYVMIDGKKVYGEYSDAKSMLTKPATPTNFAVTSKSRTAKITWSKSNGAQGYTIYVSNGRNGTYQIVKSVGATKTAYNKTGLLKGKKYYFKIRAYVKTGTGTKVYSGYSKIKAITVK